VSSSDAYLSGKDIRYAYPGGPEALAGVDAALAKGGMLAIVGPNGSGKSTLLRILAGQLSPDGGSVALAGRPLASYPRHELAKKLAFLPQSVSPAFSYTAGEVVMTGRFPHLGAFGLEGPRDAAACERVMAETATMELSARSFDTLSGGERQRVLIASVLAQEPEVLLLDEPTSALDIRFQVEIFSLLAVLAEKGLAVGVVTHDLNLAAQFAGAMALMSNGVVATSGAPAAVLKKDVLEKVYGTGVVLINNPETGTPIVLPSARPPSAEPKDSPAYPGRA
jgi:iron complex transport system ATP-binding protein